MPRVKFQVLLTIALQLFLRFKDIYALSTQPAPIKRIEKISQVKIQILPRAPASYPIFYHTDNDSQYSNIGQEVNPYEPEFWRHDEEGKNLYQTPGAAAAAAELHRDDSFLMSIVIPTPTQASCSQETKFTFFFRPTPHLFHPEAKITYQSTTKTDSWHEETGKIQTSFEYNTSPLVDQDIFAYSGWIIEQSEVEAWWKEQSQRHLTNKYNHNDWNSDPRVIGWARITIQEIRRMQHPEDLDNLILEGSFETYSDPQIWNIKSLDTYNLIRRPSDHTFPTRSEFHPTGGLIAWQETVNSGVDEKSYAAVNPRTSTSISHLQKRQSIDSIGGTNKDYSSSIGSTDGCPMTPKVVYMGIAADCTYITKYGSQAAARMAIINNLNTVSSVYERSFNISLAIIELKMQDAACPPHPSPDVPWNIGCAQSSPDGLSLDARLSAFSKWRSQKGGSDGAGLWHLMTACPNGEEVGVAWLGTLCKVKADQQDGSRDTGLNELTRRPSSSGGGSGQTTSGTGVTSANPSEWQVMAHEIGHNFGAVHDCSAGCTSGKSDQCCPFTQSKCEPDDKNAYYIMTARSSRPTSTFSACSIGNICSNLKPNTDLDTSCVSEPGAHRTITLNQCGNGIVDPGEDCDPGDTPSPCCQWGVCKFTPQAQCDPAHSPCCAPTCRFAPSGTVCRPVVDPVCDQAETCTGNNAECPADTFAQNGLACGQTGAGLSCAAGKCTSRDAQCQAQDPKLGLKQACDPAASMDCRIACKDPNNQDQCVVLEAKFAEGSPCGCGGFCSATGTCVGGNQAQCGNNWREVSHDSV
ncbi:hypothetical protein PCASD_19415 [Puccinia coronata f. sp. avenae]|uniref:Disintegrin and metalloproteinase domain-containing protein B n=1 Tax=Puccinia coronata f. sp. avenae TaxID=200324 RepID=A0A2N5SGE3_9BASI|nr:hypothetical protein PCASD_19415 [Puccinia coronata f. sp. avenae]